jgi:hypothetical protein
MLAMLQDACKLLRLKDVVSPYMSRERLLGRWWGLVLCDRKL